MKKVAIVGGVLLLGVVGFQAPKVLKSLHGSSSPTTTEAAPVQPAAPPPSLTDETPPPAGQGQLVSFSRFKAKDPFVQQVAVDTNSTGGPGTPGYKRPGSAPPAAPPPAPTSTTPTATTEPLPPPTTTAPPPPTTATLPPTTAPATGTTTAPTPTSTTPTSTAPAATSAAISTNGVCQVVAVDGTFPTLTPFFKLVSVAPDGQSVQVGIAEGSLDGGLATVTLTRGKTLTLLNKTTQVRYALDLLDGCPAPATTGTTDTTGTTTATAP